MVQCTTPSGKYKRIHTRKLSNMTASSETRLSYHVCRPKSNTINYGKVYNTHNKAKELNIWSISRHWQAVCGSGAKSFVILFVILFVIFPNWCLSCCHHPQKETNTSLLPAYLASDNVGLSPPMRDVGHHFVSL